MRRTERQTLRERFRFCCGYCGTTEVDAGGELTVDHFQPRSAGGRDTPDNRIYCCILCNDFKGDYWNPGSRERILHPERDPLAEHLAPREDGLLVPLSDTGSFHIQRLRLNRPQLVAQRQRNQELQELRQRLRQLEQENTALRHHVQAVEEQIRLLIELIPGQLS